MYLLLYFITITYLKSILTELKRKSIFLSNTLTEMMSRKGIKGRKKSVRGSENKLVNKDASRQHDIGIFFNPLCLSPGLKVHPQKDYARGEDLILNASDIQIGGAEKKCLDER